MATYMVSYDLRRERSFDDYVAVYDKLRTAVAYCWPLYSVWIVETPLTPSAIINVLVGSGVLDDNDGIIVVEMTGFADWRRVKSKETAECLARNLIKK